jgi:hypothetical protein
MQTTDVVKQGTIDTVREAWQRRLPGLAVGLLRVMFGMLWLDVALQKAPWVINAQGQRFG